MEFTALLKNLGEMVNLPELAPDENGVCRLSLDEVIVDLKATGDEKHLLLFSEVAALPIEHRDELIREILGANFLFNGTNGATLAIEDKTQAIYLQQQEALALLDIDDFSKLLNDFVTTVESWQKIVKDFQQKSFNAPEETPIDNLGNNFIRP